MRQGTACMIAWRIIGSCSYPGTSGRYSVFEWYLFLVVSEHFGTVDQGPLSRLAA